MILFSQAKISPMGYTPSVRGWDCEITTPQAIMTPLRRNLPVTSNEDKKKALDEQIAKLKARKQRLEALEKVKARKNDARAKIILGGVMLSIGRRGPDEAKRLLTTIEKEVFREADKESLKELIGELKKLATTPKESVKQSSAESQKSEKAPDSKDR